MIRSLDSFFLTGFTGLIALVEYAALFFEVKRSQDFFRLRRDTLGSKALLSR